MKKAEQEGKVNEKIEKYKDKLKKEANKEKDKTELYQNYKKGTNLLNVTNHILTVAKNEKKTTSKDNTNNSNNTNNNDSTNKQEKKDNINIDDITGIDGLE